MPSRGFFSQLNNEAREPVATQPQDRAEANSGRSSVKSNPSQSSETSNALKKETEEIKKRSKESKTLNRMKTPDNPYTGAHPNNPYVREEDLSNH